MLRFVILEHDHPELHWDFMLEANDSLRTWRLASVPVGGVAIAALKLADHRLAYLDHEGPVGGDRGSVTRWDHGVYEKRSEDESNLEVRLVGVKTQGIVRMTRLQAGWEWRWTEDVAI